MTPLYLLELNPISVQKYERGRAEGIKHRLPCYDLMPKFLLPKCFRVKTMNGNLHLNSKYRLFELYFLVEPLIRI